MQKSEDTRIVSLMLFVIFSGGFLALLMVGALVEFFL